MRLSDNALDELREIYRREFKKEISRDEAAEIGNRVVEFIQIIIREAILKQSPVPRDVDVPR